MNRESITRRPTTVLILAGILLILIAACALYVMHMVNQGFSTRIRPTKLEATIAMTLRDRAIPAHYKRMKSPVTTTPQVIHDGLAHYADHCAVCHANNGSGETMFGKTMYPRPPNLAGEDTQSMSDGQLYYTIENGVRLSGMPAFGDGGDGDEDTWKLVAFLRHLPNLTDTEQMEMQELNPKGPDEYREQLEEEQFLNGGAPSNGSQTATHHH